MPAEPFSREKMPLDLTAAGLFPAVHGSRRQGSPARSGSGIPGCLSRRRRHVLGINKPDFHLQQPFEEQLEKPLLRFELDIIQPGILGVFRFACSLWRSRWRLGGEPNFRHTSPPRAASSP